MTSSELIEEYWLSDKETMKTIELPIEHDIPELHHGRGTKQISDLSDEELEEEFKRAVELDLSLTVKFIVTWCKLANKYNFKNKYPEYFL